MAEPAGGNRARAFPSSEALLTLGALLASCTAPSETETCEGFPDWQTSQYVLPYPVGAQYPVDQANCSPPGNGHRGVGRYGYDFLMPIGTTVTVARAGTVLQVEESHFDGEIAATGFDNYVVIGHEDGTVDLYGHLTHDGADVIVGQLVAAGAIVGRSGNTGNTANKPHLHFSEHRCDPVARGSAACPTLPVTFRNTAANPNGLDRGKTYQALVAAVALRCLQKQRSHSRFVAVRQSTRGGPRPLRGAELRRNLQAGQSPGRSRGPPRQLLWPGPPEPRARRSRLYHPAGGWERWDRWVRPIASR